MYQTVFDVREAVPWGAIVFVAPGFLFIGAGVAMLRAANGQAPAWWSSLPRRSGGRKPSRKLAVFWLVFSTLWTIAGGAGLLSEWVAARSAMASGDYEVVEGQVENFDPMPYTGHESETFTVDGVDFSYSDYQVSTAFNTSRSHGGPIEEGLAVRISYLAEQRGHPILKLEIPTTEPATSDGDATVARPRVTFGMFLPLWIALVAGMFWLLRINKNPALKRTLFPIATVGGGLLFAAFSSQIYVSPLFLLLIALITVINLRQTDFCQTCGATLRSRTLLARPGPCESCRPEALTRSTR